MTEEKPGYHFEGSPILEMDEYWSKKEEIRRLQKKVLDFLKENPGRAFRWDYFLKHFDAEGEAISGLPKDIVVEIRQDGWRYLYYKPHYRKFVQRLWDKIPLE